MNTYQLALPIAAVLFLLTFGQYQVKASYHNWLQRIVGTPDVLCDAPYLATLHVGNSYGVDHNSCVGTLISSRHVVTAAGCLDHAAVVTVDLGNRQGTQSGVSVKSEKWHIHPGYYQSHRKYYNIVVIVLPSPLNLNQCIQPVSLSNNNEINNLSHCITFNKYEKEGSMELIQKQMSLSRNKCFDFFGKDQRLCEEFWATDSPNSCQEPKGSPLICSRKNNNNTQQVLAGFSSVAGCYKGHTLYVNVAFHQTWLNLILDGVPK